MVVIDQCVLDVLCLGKVGGIDEKPAGTVPKVFSVLMRTAQSVFGIPDFQVSAFGEARCVSALTVDEEVGNVCGDAVGKRCAKARRPVEFTVSPAGDPCAADDAATCAVGGHRYCVRIADVDGRLQKIVLGQPRRGFP